MICPRYHTCELDEKDRQGVKIDGCPSCRGVWLDRGEREKLIAHAAADLPGRRDDDRGRRDDDDDRYRGHRRRSWWDDIFD